MTSKHQTLFDIDGTSLDINDATTRAWMSALRCFGHDIPHDRRRPLIGRGGDKLLAEAVGSTVTRPRASRYRMSESASFAPLPAPLQLTAGARAPLERLGNDGFQLKVATSATVRI